MAFRNILVPYDDSPLSIKALKIALNMAKNFDSTVSVIICLTMPITGFWIRDVGLNKTVMENQKKAAEKSAKKVQGIAKKVGVPINVNIIKTDSIPKRIITFAKTFKIDLIVMGSHGRTGWDKIVLGNVANGVLQKVPMPVMIIK